MGTSLTLFRVFDIDVRLHWSFFLILVYGAFSYSSGPAGPLFGALYGILVILLLFLCVTLHEFGHALVAKYYKIRVRDITLLPIGGVANLERMPDKPVQELVIASAGPLVNFAIAAVLLPLMLLVVGMQMRAGTIPADWSLLWSAMQMPGVGNLLLWLVVTNILLGVFNLLPAFPMDGGRILRSLLAMVMSYVRATRIAVLVGRFMAVLLAVWGIFLWSSQGTGLIMLLIAFFVYVGGTAEREAVESRAVLKNVLASQALTPSAVNLYTSENLSRAMDLLMNSYQTDYPVMDLSGHFVGVLTRPRLIGSLKQQGPDPRIVHAMLKADHVPVCAPGADLAEIWDKMMEQGVRVVSIQEQGDFQGLITIDDITEVFHVLSAAKKNALSGDHDNAGEKVSDRAADV